MAATIRLPALPRRVWLEINLDTLIANYRKISQTVAPCSVLPVLKANAYGLGVVPIAQALVQAGARRIAIAEPHEAMQLHNLVPEIQILSSILPQEIAPMLAADIILPVTDLTTAQAISAAAQAQNKVARVHLKIDSGMGRLGILLHEAHAQIMQIRALPNLALEGIFTHFPCAYERGSDLTHAQIDGFCDLLQSLKTAGLTFKQRHIANSDAVNNFPRAFQAPFNLVRSGINLHGSFDSQGQRNLQVKPILTLKTRLAASRTLPAGTKIGYGHTYHLHQAMRVGTISAGYADGLPLALSNHGYVLIHGIPCPVIGRLSMDYTTVSLASVPEAQVGDEVICLGGSGLHAQNVEDWAALKNTHPYEIICSFGNRVERRFLGNPPPHAAPRV